MSKNKLNKQEQRAALEELKQQLKAEQPPPPPPKKRPEKRRKTDAKLARIRERQCQRRVEETAKRMNSKRTQRDIELIRAAAARRDAERRDRQARERSR